MNYLIDTHVHTLASGHAYSTVDECAQWASKKGLQLIAITDHTGTMPGAPHDFYFSNLKVIPEELYGVQILKGAETNIIDYEGNVDLPEFLMEELDLVIASFHPPCIEFPKGNEATKALENVMKNPNVNIIGHPGDQRYPFDFEKIARLAKETHTALEVNQASLVPGTFRPGVRESLIELLNYCKKYETSIVVGSDAHVAYVIGDFKESDALLKELDFPEKLILNTEKEKFLQFISKKALK